MTPATTWPARRLTYKHGTHPEYLVVGRRGKYHLLRRIGELPCGARPWSKELTLTRRDRRLFWRNV